MDFNNGFCVCVCVCVCVFLGPHLWYMDVPKLGVKSVLQLPATATVTATASPNPSPTTYTTAHGNVQSLTH